MICFFILFLFLFEVDTANASGGTLQGRGRRSARESRGARYLHIQCEVGTTTVVEEEIHIHHILVAILLYGDDPSVMAGLELERYMDTTPPATVMSPVPPTIYVPGIRVVASAPLKNIRGISI